MRRLPHHLQHLLRQPFKLAGPPYGPPHRAYGGVRRGRALPGPRRRVSSRAGYRRTAQVYPGPDLARRRALAETLGVTLPTTPDELPAWTQRWPLLVVDDDYEWTVLLRFMYERTGFTVITTQSASEALKICLHVPVSLVHTNITMPDMYGDELCQRLQANPDLAHLPVLLVSARLMLDSILHGLECGAVGYVTKPALAYELIVSVTDLLLRYGNWLVPPPDPDPALIAQWIDPGTSPGGIRSGKQGPSPVYRCPPARDVWGREVDDSFRPYTSRDDIDSLRARVNLA